MKEEKNIVEQLEAKLPVAFGRSAIDNLLRDNFQQNPSQS